MPTRRSPPGPSRSAAMRSATAGSVRSTQPTTPRMNGTAAAIARNSRVSSRLDRVWTRTVASTRAASRSGPRSSGPNGRRIDGELVGQPRVVGASPGPRSGGGRRRSRRTFGHVAGTGALGREQALGAQVGPEAAGMGAPSAPGTPRDGRCGGRRRSTRRRPDGRAGTGSRPPAAGRRAARRPRRSAGPDRRGRRGAGR